MSILADYFGERPTKRALYYGKPRCWRYHQGFKWAFIAGLPKEGWFITEDEIRQWLKEKRSGSG
jgi:hypothetical protein